MKSPFKFLDPFELSDRDTYAGRDNEIKTLYQLVFKTPLLLIYGMSGTGKTSLIQCGLASQFDGADWLPLWVRRQKNINDSLETALKRLQGLASEPIGGRTVPEQISQLYQQYLRPVFLIFDQFEELFILGSDDEIEKFTATLKAVLADELPCTILLVMREEYLAHLYSLEKEIPSLFDFRMRVEPMNTANVKKALKETFTKFNISIGESESMQEDRLNDIIQNVSQGRSGIELPYLQVYLDLLYREDYERSNVTQKKTDTNPWPALEFTKTEIKEFGTIENVLEKFLKEQQEQIQDKLIQLDEGIAKNTVKLVLDGFVTEEGTKRPVTYERQNEWWVPEKAQWQYFPSISPSHLSTCWKELEAARILRANDDSIELAHDSLAKIIDKYRTEEERQRNDIKRQIRSSKATFSKTGEYLTRKQVTLFEDMLPLLGLKQDEIDFFRTSKQYREEEDREELTKEKERAKRLRNFAIAAFAGLIVALGAMFLAWNKMKEAEEAEGQAKSAQIAAENNLRQFQRTEVKAYLLDAETFLKSGDRAEVKIALDSAENITNRFFADTPEYDSLLSQIKRIAIKQMPKP